MGGGAFGSALFAGWEGVLLAAHFSRAGRGCFGSALFAGWDFVDFSSGHVFGLRDERVFAGFQHKRKLPKIWLALVLSYVSKYGHSSE